MSSVHIAFENLADADLHVGTTYMGGACGHVGDDPLARLMRCGNMGGFRFTGPLNPFAIRQCVLYSELDHPDWPDCIDESRRVLTYFGDNRRFGMDLHTSKGNRVLRELFHRLHAGRRCEIPPVFVLSEALAAM